MRSLSLVSVIAIAVMMGSCKSGGNSASGSDSLANNPFLVKSALPFEAPDFSKIKDGDYKPAMEEGIKRQLAEIQKIADNPDVPTFENTLVAMEKSGDLLNRVNGVFNLLTGANTNPTLQKVQEEEA